MILSLGIQDCCLQLTDTLALLSNKICKKVFCTSVRARYSVRVPTSSPFTYLPDGLRQITELASQFLCRAVGSVVPFFHLHMCKRVQNLNRLRTSVDTAKACDLVQNVQCTMKKNAQISQNLYGVAQFRGLLLEALLAAFQRLFQLVALLQLCIWRVCQICISQRVGFGHRKSECRVFRNKPSLSAGDKTGRNQLGEMARRCKNHFQGLACPDRIAPCEKLSRNTPNPFSI